MAKPLYPFQLADVLKLSPHPAGLIGSEVGSGKTLEAIALDWSFRTANGGSKATGPTLVVTPLNTFAGWQRQYAAQDPAARVCTVGRTAKSRDAFLHQVAQAVLSDGPDVFVTHWEGLRLMPGLAAVQWGTVIADEVHRAGNPKATTTTVLKSLRAHRRLGLSGTPAGDMPEGFWSILNWLYPHSFKNFWDYRMRHCKIEKTMRGDTLYEKVVGVKNVGLLLHEISPYFVRHLKREACCADHPNGVMPWLPPLAYDEIEVELSPKQRKMYEQMRKESLAWVGEHEDQLLEAKAVARLSRLSQICLATPTITAGPPDADGEPTFTVDLELPSSKIEAVIERINDMGGRKVAVFTASKKAAYLLMTRMIATGLDAVTLTGDTANRQGAIDSFVTGPKQVFIGVIAACAEGIDGLQHVCDTAIFMDRDWRTYLNDQAIGRLDRDGQRNSVLVIDIVARDTIDEARTTRLELKSGWMKQLLGDVPPKAEPRSASLVALPSLGL